MTGESKPWDTWPAEMPSCKDPLPDQTLITKLLDAGFFRKLNKEIRAQVFARLSASSESVEMAGGAAVFEGGRSDQFELYQSDTTPCVFRQEQFFRYIFGCYEPDCFGILDLDKQETILLVPQHSQDSQRWNGVIKPLADEKERWGVDEVRHVSELAQVLKERNIAHVYTLKGENTDSGLSTKNTAQLSKETFAGQVDEAALYPVMVESRVHKTRLEIELMRTANLVSSMAHVYCMRHSKPGLCERQFEAMFSGYTGFVGGSRHLAYTAICGCGGGASVLHYGHAGRPNDQFSDEADIALMDLGAEFEGYSTDITCSYPVNGRFSDRQKAIYEIVLDSNLAVQKAMAPGQSWTALHRLSERRILEGLVKIGLLQGSVDEMEAVHLASIFMPHGLGHLLGLDVHDCGGFTAEHPKSKEMGLCYLRCVRPLEESMVITVEPGCYFIDPWLDKALANPAQAKFINQAELVKYRGMGGVRIEDNVLVTKTGSENFTIVPRTVDEIEQCMNQFKN